MHADTYRCRIAHEHIHTSPRDCRAPLTAPHHTSNTYMPTHHTPSQDLKGQFSGSIQAFGSSGGATSVEFDLKGSTWQWGDYGLDQV